MTSGDNFVISVIGSGSMTLYNDSYSNNTPSTVLNALSGNDTVINCASSVTINGEGGANNDTISLSSGANNNLIKYANGDGNDNIYCFNANDTNSITSGSYTTAVSGQDVIVKVGND